MPEPQVRSDRLLAYLEERPQTHTTPNGGIAQ
jgi:hypothetical protein